MVLTTNSQCTASGAFQQQFSQFISTCASADDNSAINNIIKSDDIKGIIEDEQAVLGDLISSLTGLKDLRTPGSVSEDPVARRSSLEKQMTDIEAKIKENTNKIDAQNQMFLQGITSAPKKTNTLANFNDLSLFIFFGSFFVFTVVVTVIQGTKINGSLKTSAYTLIGMLVIGIVLYALIKEVA
jgi:hypothetical protein